MKEGFNWVGRYVVGRQVLGRLPNLGCRQICVRPIRFLEHTQINALLIRLSLSRFYLSSSPLSLSFAFSLIVSFDLAFSLSLLKTLETTFHLFSGICFRLEEASESVLLCSLSVHHLLFPGISHPIHDNRNSKLSE